MNSHYESANSGNMVTIDDERSLHSDGIPHQDSSFTMRLNLLGNEDNGLQSGVEKGRSRRLDYKDKDSLFHSTRFLFECGYKLKCSPETIAAAAALFHRFFKECEGSSYDKYLIASTTLYIVGKLYDEKYKIRDVINVAHNTLNRGSSPLDLGDDYWMRRDAIVQAELLIMRMLSFNVTYTHPHKYLLHYLMTLKTWIPCSTWEAVPIIPASYAFLQDLHHDPVVLQYSPQHVAIACITLALLCYGIETPNSCEMGEKKWYNFLVNNLTDEELAVITDSIMDVYNQDSSVHGVEV